MTKVGIYHFQFCTGGCKICYRNYIQSMLVSFEKCHEVAKGIYGDDCEFIHFTDFGPYSGENTDRPHFHLMLQALERREFDVLMCYQLNNITRNEKALLELYQKVRSMGMDFITAQHGKDAMKYLDLYIEKQKAAGKL